MPPHRTARVLALAASLAAGCHAALAQEYEWIGAFGGDWHEPKNWSLAAVPSVVDSGSFGYRDGAYTVVSDRNAALDRLIARRGHVTLNFDRFILALARVDGTPSLLIGENPGDDAAITVQRGRINTYDSVLGAAQGASGNLLLASSIARIVGQGVFTVGGNGAGALRMAPGSRFSAPVLRIGPGGVLSGAGSLTAGEFTSDGAVAPDASTTPGTIGTLAHLGPYVQSALGALRVDIAAGGAIPGHDRFAVTGAATLAGTLEVSLLPSYTPQAWDAFPVLTATSINGFFDALMAPPLPGDLSWRVEYAPTAVTLVVVPTAGTWVALLPAAGLAAGRRRRWR